MTDTLTDTVAERVARGVALLDEKRPGWTMEIELSRLDMWSANRCILGQTFSGFAVGVDSLALDESEVYASGFDISPEEWVSVFDQLQAEWVRVITDRRSTHEVTL